TCHCVVSSHRPLLPPVSFSSSCLLRTLAFFFFFTDAAPPEIYTLSLHDALPILARGARGRVARPDRRARRRRPARAAAVGLVQARAGLPPAGRPRRADPLDGGQHGLVQEIGRAHV